MFQAIQRNLKTRKPKGLAGFLLSNKMRRNTVTDCNADEIKEFCQDNMAHFKIPKLIFFVDSFPMTVTGKLQKFRMREMTLEKLKVHKNLGNS